MPKPLSIVAIAWLAGAGLLGQTSNQAFDVTSVKPNSSGELAMRITAPPGTGRFDATNVSARQLILNSYGLRDFQLADLPVWAASERFDVAGRTAEPATRDQISAMVRALLTDRFRLSEQLGLRLNATRGPVEVLVIDRIERPAAD
jgi:hypothetical protein